MSLKNDTEKTGLVKGANLHLSLIYCDYTRNKVQNNFYLNHHLSLVDTP